MSYMKHITEINTDLVIELICGYLKVNKMHLFEKDSEKKIVYARFMVFFVLARIFKVDYLDIASIFKMNHASIYYGSEQILNGIVLERGKKGEYNDVRKLIVKNMKRIVLIPEAKDLKL